MTERASLYDITSLNYIGAKKKLLPFLDTLITPKLSATDTFLDLFAGSGIVSSLFRHRCQRVFANDIELYSYVVNRAFLCCNYTPKLDMLIKEINTILEAHKLEPNTRTDLIYTEYSPASQKSRMFFTIDNALRIDKTRQHIEALKNTNQVSELEYHFLLASMLISADKLANTTCVYSAFLKSFKKSAQDTFILKPLHTFDNIPNCHFNSVFNSDAINLLKELKDKDKDITVDVDHIYIDPPYCTRQYGANYGFLNYLLQYDNTVEIIGKTGVLKTYYKSPYAQKANAQHAFSDLIDHLAPKKSIFISYNSEGILTKDELIQLLKAKGHVTLYKKPYRRYASTISKIEERLVEYLFYVDCQQPACDVCIEIDVSTATASR